MLATKPEFAGENVTVAHEQQKSERDEHRYQADDAIPLHAGQIARGYYADDNGGDHCAQEHHAFIGESQRPITRLTTLRRHVRHARRGSIGTTTGIAAGIVAGIALGIVTGIAGAVCTNGCGAAE